MNDPTVENLIDALRVIRAAARNVGIHGWSNAPELDRVIRANIAVVQYPFAFGRRITGYKDRVAMNCEFWAAAYPKAHSRLENRDPADVDLKQSGIQMVRGMASQIDMFLVALPPAPLRPSIG